MLLRPYGVTDLQEPVEIFVCGFEKMLLKILAYHSLKHLLTDLHPTAISSLSKCVQFSLFSSFLKGDFSCLTVDRCTFITLPRTANSRLFMALTNMWANWKSEAGILIVPHRVKVLLQRLVEIEYPLHTDVILL